MNGYHKTTNEPYQEIWKLQEMLEKAKIPYEFEPVYDGWHILYPGSAVTTCSCIEHFYSYGSRSDRLEIMGLLTPDEIAVNSVAGYLSADEVFGRIRSHYERHSKKQ